MFKGKFIKSGMTVFLCFVLLVVMAFGGCGKVETSDKSLNEDDYMSTIDGNYEQDVEMGDFGTSESPAMEDGMDTRETLAPTSFVHGENVKLIYTAYLSLQTVDFEKAELQFINVVKTSEGYFEASYVDRGSYYSEDNHIYGSYTVRIPQKNYESFLAAVGETSHVLSINKNVTDIGIEYFDTETRLSTLQAKFDRLTELFKEATQMSDIITLENALADTQYQIDTYTSTLNRYDSLVDYSTVTVSLEQVDRLDSGIDEDEGFFASLARNFVNGINHFVDNVGNMFMWIAYNIVAIVIVIGLLILTRKWYVKKIADKGSLFPGIRIKKIAEKVRRTDKKRASEDKEE